MDFDILSLKAGGSGEIWGEVSKMVATFESLKRAQRCKDRNKDVCVGLLSGGSCIALHSNASRRDRDTLMLLANAKPDCISRSDRAESCMAVT